MRIISPLVFNSFKNERAHTFFYNCKIPKEGFNCTFLFVLKGFSESIFRTWRDPDHARSFLTKVGKTIKAQKRKKTKQNMYSEFV